MNNTFIDEVLVRFGVNNKNMQIANRLESYCRYLKNGTNVAEFRVKDGSNHIDRLAEGKRNHIDFDSYLIFYRYEHLEGNIYDFGDEEGCIGFLNDANGTICLFNPETNEIIKKYVVKY